ncbi:MAG: hypothetical protein MJ014_05760 [Methanocorpusculum sp.]|nr:hypothetical protein [Methanocorpusculum sp.]
MRSVLDEYTWLSFTLDCAHAQVALPDDPFAFLRDCQDRMVNIHASLGTERMMHTPLAGTLAGEQLKQELIAAKYVRLVAFELEDLNFWNSLDYAEKNHRTCRRGSMVFGSPINLRTIIHILRLRRRFAYDDDHGFRTPE